MTTFRDAIIDRCREQGLPFSTEVLDIAAQLHEADVEELHGLAATEWLDDTTKLKAEVERLKGLLNRDHTGLAAGLNRCRQIGRGYFWIALGEWGSYDYTERTEQTLRMEIGNCLEEIEQTAVTALRESGVRAHAAFRPERDRIAVVERLLAGCEAAFHAQSEDFEKLKSKLDHVYETVDTIAGERDAALKRAEAAEAVVADLRSKRGADAQNEREMWGDAGRPRG